MSIDMDNFEKLTRILVKRGLAATAYRHLADTQTMKLEETIERVRDNYANLLLMFNPFGKKILHHLHDIRNKKARQIKKLGMPVPIEDYEVHDLAEALLDYRLGSMAHGKIPASMRAIETAVLAFLDEVEPEYARTIRGYTPRSAFRTVMREVTANPMGLVDVTSKQRGELREYSQLADGTDSIYTSRLHCFMGIAKLIEPDVIREHREKIPELVRRSYRQRRGENDADYISRILDAHMDLYPTIKPCEVNLLPDDGSNHSATYHFNGSHVFDFYAFHKASRKRKFKTVAHEATHKETRERGFRASANVPHLHVRQAAAACEQSGCSMITVNDARQARASSRGTYDTNYSHARKLFGETEGLRIYRLEALEREARFVELIAEMTIDQLGGNKVRAKKLEAEADRVVHDDLNPDTINRTFNHHEYLKRMRRPQLYGYMAHT
jgi:hypothetical protein